MELFAYLKVLNLTFWKHFVTKQVYFFKTGIQNSPIFYTLCDLFQRKIFTPQ
jgi:hypothetical protein